MTGLAVPLVWCFVHVTLFAIVALFASWLAGRSGPRATATTLVVGLLLLLAVTALSFAPWPQALRVPLARATRPAPSTEADEATSPIATLALSLLLENNEPAVAESPASGPTTVNDRASGWRPPALSLGMLFWLIPLASVGALALWCHALVSLRAYLRQSERIDDARLGAMVESLQNALHYRGAIELRATSAIAAPATIGWRRPVILMPVDWSAWSESQLRAVLAHEIAHIARGDYATWVAARFVQAIHCCHPLVRWLVARLHLAQELAADALAAPLAGGREPYLQALAAVALATDNQPTAWHARAFLSNETGLLRRIAMLRERGSRMDSRSRGTSRQMALGAGLVVASLLVLGLRQPAARVAQAADEKPRASGNITIEGKGINSNAGLIGTITITDGAQVQGTLNIDITGPKWLPTSGSALLKLSKPDTIRATFVAQSLKSLRVEGAENLPVDQVSAVWQGMDFPNTERGPIPLSLVVLEFAAPHAWQEAAKKNKWASEDVGGATLYRSGLGAIWLPDDKTAAIGSIEAVRKQIEDIAHDTGTNWSGRIAFWQGRTNLLAMDTRGIAHLVESSPAEWRDQLADAIGTAWLMVWAAKPEESEGTAFSFLYPNETEAARHLARMKELIVAAKGPGLPPQLMAMGLATANGPEQIGNRIVIETKTPAAALGEGALAATRAAQRAEAMNNLKIVTLAWHHYHDANQSFPAQAIYSKEGKPLLSWRVTILPQLGPSGKELYEKFKLDEPWDSPHNIKLLDEMPAVFAHPGAEKTHYTSIVAPAGEHYAMRGQEGTTYRQFTDGTSNTIALIETKTEIPWTKPEDLNVTPELTPEKLTTYFDEGFLTAFADGSVRFVAKGVDKDVLHKLLTRDGGEIISFPE